MKSEVLSRFTMMYLPVIGFFIFFCFFIGAVIWVFRPASKEFYKKMSKLPLED
jgi:cbb3-type cytochrome oxidase subunit 3